MRDPDRIEPTLDKIREFWKKHPDLRLAQIIVNAVGANRPTTQCPTVFYMEDDYLMEGLAKLEDIIDDSKN